MPGLWAVFIVTTLHGAKSKESWGQDQNWKISPNPWALFTGSKWCSELNAQSKCKKYKDNNVSVWCLSLSKIVWFIWLFSIIALYDLKFFWHTGGTQTINRQTSWLLDFPEVSNRFRYIVSTEFPLIWSIYWAFNFFHATRRDCYKQSTVCARVRSSRTWHSLLSYSTFGCQRNLVSVCTRHY